MPNPVIVDPEVVNEPKKQRVPQWTKDDIKAIAKEGLEQTLEFEADPKAKYKVFENIVDKDGHPRFIEGVITPFKRSKALREARDAGHEIVAKRVKFQHQIDVVKLSASL